MVKEMLISLGLSILQRLAQSVYDAVWAVVFEAVKDAEETWRDVSNGDVKKSWALERTMAYLESRKLLKWHNSWLVRRFLDYAIDNIITELNNEFGHSWTEQVSNLRAHLASKIPFIN